MRNPEVGRVAEQREAAEIEAAATLAEAEEGSYEEFFAPKECIQSPQPTPFRRYSRPEKQCTTAYLIEDNFRLMKFVYVRHF